MPAVEEVPTRFGGYVRGEELGRGTFATVFACTQAGTGEHFAAKTFDLRQLRLSRNMGREVKKLQREAKVLQQMPPHPNLVRFYDVVQEGNWLFFMLELVDGGNLFSYLVKRPGKKPRLREDEARFVVHQLTEGLSLLHSRGIIHRDLKLENVLVARVRAEGPEVKITDFGLSKAVGDGQSEAISTVGSPMYMAPEVVAKGTHDFQADLWSLGVLVHVLLDGRFPCDSKVPRSSSRGKLSQKVKQEELDAAVQSLPVSDNAQAVVLGLLQFRTEKRMTIQQLEHHPWLALARAPAGAAAGDLAGGGRARMPKRPRPRPRLRVKPVPLAAAGAAAGAAGARPAGRAPNGRPPAGDMRRRKRPSDPAGRGGGEAALFGPDEDAAVASAAAEVAEAVASPTPKRFRAGCLVLAAAGAGAPAVRAAARGAARGPAAASSGSASRASPGRGAPRRRQSPTP